MTNSWSFLSDELNMSNQDYWKGDGLSIVGNPGAASPDTIVFSSSHLPGGMGNDHITFTGNGIKAAETVPIDYFGSGDNISFGLPTPSKPQTNSKQKYSEDVIIKELKDYITRTYDQHLSLIHISEPTRPY